MQQYSVHSLDRALDILEILSEAERGLTLTELSGRAQLNKSTAFRLLAALISRGYISKTEGGTYHLSFRMFEVGSRALNGMGPLPVIQPCLQKLAADSGEAVHFVVREGSSVVYLYKEASRASMLQMASFVGLRNPMYCTGVGKAVLAFLPDNERDAIIDSCDFTPFTAKTVKEPCELLADLELVRRRGYAVDDEEHEAGVKCIAAPVLDDRGFAYAAVSVSAPAFRMGDPEAERCSRLVVSAAHELSTLLGRSTGTRE